ncbi:MAG: hypothetical protein M1824_001077 [Vezdaea acicularis]|nr:MAG: hypothetical protein M1824_001077 [Vezdaea acicularis]
MDELTADGPCPTDNFAPTEGSWPPTWTKQMVFDAIYVTFDLFTEPTEEEIIERLKAIECDSTDYPCKALRRVFDIQQPEVFSADLVAKFRHAFPECEKTDRELVKALALDVKTKRNIIFQAKLEDSTRTKDDYIKRTSKIPEDLNRRVVRYPRIIIVDEKKAPGQDRPIGRYNRWVNKAGCLETPKDKQNNTVIGPMSPSRQDTPMEEPLSMPQQNDTVIDRISLPRQDPPTEELRFTARQNDTVIDRVSLPRHDTPTEEPLSTPQQNDTVIDRISLPRQDTPTEELSITARKNDTVDTLIGSPATKKRTGLANPYWRLPELEYPKGTWQPTDGHGNPDNKTFLLFDPRGPLEVLTARVYSAGEEHLMVFPVYVDLSDRALGHIVRSMIPFRKKSEYWPHDFRKDCKISSNRVPKGAGYFFIDGRVGALENITLVGADFNGPVPKTWNIIHGSAKPSNPIYDQVPNQLAIENCYINQPIVALATSSRRPRSPSPPGSASSGRYRKSAKTDGDLGLVNRARRLLTVIARRTEEKVSNNKDWKEAWDTFSFLSGVQEQPDKSVTPFQQLGVTNKSSSPSILKYTATGQLFQHDNAKTGGDPVVDDDVGGSDSDSIKSHMYANSVASRDGNDDKDSS